MSRAPPLPRDVVERLARAQSLMYFPLRGDWYWHTVVKPSVKVPPGASFDVYRVEGAGWVYYVFVACNNPDLEFKLDLYADGSIESTFSPNILRYYTAYARPQGVALVAYDPVRNLYCMEFAPGIVNGLGVPFRGRHRLVVSNPTTTEAQFTIWAWIIRLKPGGGRL